MTLKRLSLTLFFIVLTLSIGLVSVNSPLSAKAQNSALSQSGNGDAEQETEQVLSSEQNGQVVSGHGSLLSGNNVLCQDQEKSQLNESCETPIDNIPSIPNGNTAQLEILAGLGNTFCFGNECPNPTGFIRVIDISDNNRELAKLEPYSPFPNWYDGPFFCRDSSFS